MKHTRTVVAFICGAIVSVAAMSLASPPPVACDALALSRIDSTLEKIELDVQMISRQISMR